MSCPKSVVKFKNGGVTYTSNLDAAQYTILELTRAAMRDVGKFIVRKANSQAMKTLRGMKKSRRVRGKTSTFLYSVPWAKDGLPHCEVGVAHNTWYGVEQEIGSSKMKKHGILRNTTYDNISTIREIEKQYLSGIDDSASDIDESETLMEGAD